MALPSRTMPSSLPPWQAQGYTAEPEPLFAHAAMTTGHARTRRLYTAANRRERAGLRLTPAQLPVWHAWVEDDLQAGSLPFAAQVANLGPGVRWYEALLLEWPSDPRAGGRTLVECTLLLRGPAYLTGPAP